MMKKAIAIVLALAMAMSLAACGISETTSNNTQQTTQSASAETTVITAGAEKADIEQALNLANIKPTWTYSEDADAWTMGIVTAVANAELPDYQGVSV